MVKASSDAQSFYLITHWTWKLLGLIWYMTCY